MIYENSFKIYYCRYDLKSSAIKDVIFGILQAIVPFSMSIGYILEHLCTHQTQTKCTMQSTQTYLRKINLRPMIIILIILYN